MPNLVKRVYRPVPSSARQHKCIQGVMCASFGLFALLATGGALLSILGLLQIRGIIDISGKPSPPTPFGLISANETILPTGAMGLFLQSMGSNEFPQWTNISSFTLTLEDVIIPSLTKGYAVSVDPVTGQLVTVYPVSSTGGLASSIVAYDPQGNLVVSTIDIMGLTTAAGGIRLPNLPNLPFLATDIDGHIVKSNFSFENVTTILIHQELTNYDFNSINVTGDIRTNLLNIAPLAGSVFVGVDSQGNLIQTAFAVSSNGTASITQRTQLAAYDSTGALTTGKGGLNASLGPLLGNNLTITSNATIGGNAQIEGTLIVNGPLSLNGSSGMPGDIMVSQGNASSPVWTPMPSASLDINGPLYLNGSSGTPGDIMVSQGNVSSPVWLPTMNNAVLTTSSTGMLSMNQTTPPVSIGGLATTVATGGVTYLTPSSALKQVLTGSNGETFVLPAAANLPPGIVFSFIHNGANQFLVVTDDGNNTLTIVTPGASADVTLTAAGTYGTWFVEYHNSSEGVTRTEIYLWTVPGSYTWTPPVGSGLSLTAICVGGGGGGGGAGNYRGDGQYFPGGGGGGAGGVTAVYLPAPSAPVTVVVGSGGVHGPPGGGGGTGGTSSFGNVSAAGGLGGQSGGNQGVSPGGAPGPISIFGTSVTNSHGSTGLTSSDVTASQWLPPATIYFPQFYLPTSGGAGATVPVNYGSSGTPGGATSSLNGTVNGTVDGGAPGSDGIAASPWAGTGGGGGSSVGDYSTNGGNGILGGGGGGGGGSWLSANQGGTGGAGVVYIVLTYVSFQITYLPLTGGTINGSLATDDLTATNLTTTNLTTTNLNTTNLTATNLNATNLNASNLNTSLLTVTNNATIAGSLSVTGSSEVSSILKLNGPLSLKNNSGISGQLMVSQGSSSPPTWLPGMNNAMLVTNSTGAPSWFPTMNDSMLVIGSTGEPTWLPTMDNAMLVTNSAGAVSFSQVTPPVSVGGFTVTLGANSTTKLTALSTLKQFLLGITGQTFVLPNSTGLPLGLAFLFRNGAGNGTLVITDDYSNTLARLATGCSAEVVLVNNGTNGTWVVKNGGSCATTINTEIWTTPGSYTWTPPTGAGSDMVVICVGGGGGGGGAGSGFDDGGGGGGGAGGVTAVQLSVPFAPVTVVVGSGGAGGAASSGGGNGSTSSFGWVSAAGGMGAIWGGTENNNPGGAAGPISFFGTSVTNSPGSTGTTDINSNSIGNQVSQPVPTIVFQPAYLPTSGGAGIGWNTNSVNGGATTSFAGTVSGGGNVASAWAGTGGAGGGASVAGGNGILGGGGGGGGWDPGQPGGNGGAGVVLVMTWYETADLPVTGGTLDGSLSITGDLSLAQPLPFTSGGTGTTGFTLDTLVFASEGSLQSLNPGFSGYVLQSLGERSPPAWVNISTIVPAQTAISGTTNQIDTSGYQISLSPNLVTPGSLEVSTSLTVEGVATFDSNATISGTLDMTSTATAFLPPRMTTTQKTAISNPAQGGMVFDTTENALNVYDGSSWQPFMTSWQPFTTTVTGTITNPVIGTETNISSSYMVIGKMMFLQMYLVQSPTSTGAATGNGTYLFNLPPGFTIGTTITTLYSGASSKVYPTIGSASVWNPTIFSNDAVGVVVSSTAYALYTFENDLIGSASFPLGTPPNTFTVNLQIPLT